MHEREQPDRRSGGRLRGLLLLNVLLLGLLGAVTFGPTAGAQDRTRGQYIMAGGGAPGSLSGIVWIADVVNQELIAVTADPNAKPLVGIGYRNFPADIAELARGASSR
jgi:hypothetical protein